MKNFLDYHFWFNPSPGTYSPVYLYLIAGTVVVLFVGSFVLKILAIKQKSVYSVIMRRLSGFSLTYSIIIGAFLFFNTQIIPYLSSRFWYPIIGITMAVWLYFILKELKLIPQRKAERAKKEEFKKYIP
jgi:hypothetical protein